ncbi:hypothetical protein POM88_021621 [Heracleum sosnowskyi]|uniref:Uncharacterized protein n=1 Tax=Heracleum sosnowskyi TaxID=360622 RepID=A0AAD8IE82_9APIA|nr:hypothetical protein POM88_021621 [Heracleum sosnowskyi]
MYFLYPTNDFLPTVKCQIIEFHSYTLSQPKEVRSQQLPEKKAAGRKPSGLGALPAAPASIVDTYEKLLSSILEFSSFGKLFKKLKYFQNSEVEVKPLRSLPYDLQGQTFVAFEKPEGCCWEFFEMIDAFSREAEDGGVEDEYQSEDLEVVAEDYILKGSEVVPNNARPHTCLLSGVYIENVKVLVILSFGIDISDDISVSDALHEIGASGSLVGLMNKVRHFVGYCHKCSEYFNEFMNGRLSELRFGTPKD